MTTTTEPMPTLEQVVLKIESNKIAKGITYAELAKMMGQSPV